MPGAHVSLVFREMWDTAESPKDSRLNKFFFHSHRSERVPYFRTGVRGARKMGEAPPKVCLLFFSEFHGRRRGSTARQKRRQHPLPVPKQGPNLPPDGQLVCQVTQQPQRQLVLHLVAHHAAIWLISNPMAVVKVLERPPPLLIAEIFIPAKLGNVCVPFESQRDQRNRAKTYSNQ
jgi:hypothetical protein